MVRSDCRLFRRATLQSESIRQGECVPGKGVILNSPRQTRTISAIFMSVWPGECGHSGLPRARSTRRRRRRRQWVCSNRPLQVWQVAKGRCERKETAMWSEKDDGVLGTAVSQACTLGLGESIRQPKRDLYSHVMCVYECGRRAARGSNCCRTCKKEALAGKREGPLY